MELSNSVNQFAPVLQIVAIDLLLSGDNAILIALASRQLPQELQRKAMIWGTVAAVSFRVLLTFLATLLLRAPFLKLTGAVFLFMIAIDLMQGQSKDDAASRLLGRGANNIGKAMLMIVVADAIMSVDNVVAVAAAAQDQIGYLILGLLLSIPILVFASVLVARLMAAYPVIVDVGAAILGWVAGQLVVTDPAISDFLQTQSFALVALAPLLGAIYVYLQGKRIRANQTGTATAIATRPPSASTEPAIQAARTVTPPADTVAARTAVAYVLPAETLTQHEPAADVETATVPPSPPVSDKKMISPMDMVILAGVAIPALGFVVTILYIIGKAISHH